MQRYEPYFYIYENSVSSALTPIFHSKVDRVPESSGAYSISIIRLSANFEYAVTYSKSGLIKVWKIEYPNIKWLFSCDAPLMEQHGDDWDGYLDVAPDGLYAAGSFFASTTSNDASTPSNNNDDHPTPIELPSLNLFWD